MTPSVTGHRSEPIKTYGASKLMIEQSMYWMGKAYGLKWIALRYFKFAAKDMGKTARDKVVSAYRNF